MRCQYCNKFVGQEMGDPEIMADPDYSDGHIEGTIKIVAQCIECNSDLKEATFEIDEEVEFCSGDGHDVNVSWDDPSNYDRGEGQGRYRKTFYGAQMDIYLKCSCGKDLTVPWKEDIAASAMDEV